MEIINFDANERYLVGDLALAIGEFDGLHIAHQTLIQKMIEKANDLGLKKAILTFDPHPDFILRKKYYSGYLTPLNEKITMLEKMGVDLLIIVPFTKAFSLLKHYEFADLVLRKFSISHLVVGFDFHYGYKGLGNASMLAKLYPTTIIPQITKDGEKISSNVIREYLKNGQLEQANAMLGRCFNVIGKVEVGNQIGQKIGIRTANIFLKDEYQLLKKGVYAVYVDFNDQRWQGVCNIGNNPTLNYISRARLEVHILDFEKMIYNQILSVHFVKYLRGEKKFKNVQTLIEQIQKDIVATKKLLGEKRC
ncbi:MAG TPA: riboflavin biosynthesis protein RibF [Bacilli bacterium]|nr:MAG: Riboflavin biosynthesis protein RibF [Tenericutes bacterium ADurb.BinA124]HPX85008.1 riboflavin biosynthesis protein RibF [Bacilli bacterium]HQC75074.1 riboflavin biosynthesis protein RibF [Bacilli bacterium]